MPACKSPLARARHRAHRALDKMICTGMATGEVYKWIARRLRISGAECHISQFDKKRADLISQAMFTEAKRRRKTK